MKRKQINEALLAISQKIADHVTDIQAFEEATGITMCRGWRELHVLTKDDLVHLAECHDATIIHNKPCGRLEFWVDAVCVFTCANKDHLEAGE